MVTGGAGYLGSLVTARLLCAGNQVTVVDRFDHGGDSLLHLVGNRLLEIVPEDVCDLSSRIRGIRYDAVIHLAAVVGEEACRVAEADARRTNVDGTRKILDYSDQIVLASTASNYGRVSKGFYAREDHKLAPLSLYAETKIEAEEIVFSAGGTVLRLATLFGISPRPRFDLLVNAMARAAVMGETFCLYGLEHMRPFLHVADAARALTNCAILGSSEHRVMNVVAENVTKQRLGSIVSRILPKIRLKCVEDSINDPRDYGIDGARYFENFGGAAGMKTIHDGLWEIQKAAPLLSERSEWRYHNSGEDR